MHMHKVIVTTTVGAIVTPTGCGDDRPCMHCVTALAFPCFALLKTVSFLVLEMYLWSFVVPYTLYSSPQQWGPEHSTAHRSSAIADSLHCLQFIVAHVKLK